jgi:hypothetical protein
MRQHDQKQKLSRFELSPRDLDVENGWLAVQFSLARFLSSNLLVQFLFSVGYISLNYFAMS